MLVVGDVYLFTFYIETFMSTVKFTMLWFVK